MASYPSLPYSLIKDNYFDYDFTLSNESLNMQLNFAIFKVWPLLIKKKQATNNIHNQSDDVEHNIFTYKYIKLMLYIPVALLTGTIKVMT